jgi:8-oxo-dGTP pyrophosphatase MutT (NUDIX family)
VTNRTNGAAGRSGAPVSSTTSEILKEQYGALPFRYRTDGMVEVLLVTSRRTGRWIIPKGWPASGMRPFELAAREAMEEGGVTGRIKEQPIGCYRHKKTLNDGSVVRCKVDIFALEVEAQMSTWPECKQRSTQWFSLDEAAAAVRDPELKAVILSFNQAAFGGPTRC